MNYLVLSQKEIDELRRRARRGWVTFGVGVLLAVSGAFGAGYRTGRERALVEVRLVRENQEMTVKHLERAWQDQRNGIDTIVSASETIRQRDEIVRHNQENTCPDFQKAMARGK